MTLCVCVCVCVSVFTNLVQCHELVGGKREVLNFSRITLKFCSRLHPANSDSFSFVFFFCVFFLLLFCFLFLPSPHFLWGGVEWGLGAQSIHGRFNVSAHLVVSVDHAPLQYTPILQSTRAARVQERASVDGWRQVAAAVGWAPSAVCTGHKCGHSFKGSSPLCGALLTFLSPWQKLKETMFRKSITKGEGGVNAIRFFPPPSSMEEKAFFWFLSIHN